MAALALLVILAPAARADRTRLLEVDLKTGRRKKIDAKKGQTSADRELDSMLGSTMGHSFSTADLERVEQALRRHLQLQRPRATARMLLFLYPGRVTRSALTSMREVLVDIEMVVDPCSRSICRDSVAKHLELLGRSLKQAVLRTRDYQVRFKSITIRTVTAIGGGETDVYRFTADQAVKVGRGGGASGLVRSQDQARAGYERAMVKAIARQLQNARVRTTRPPQLEKTRQAVTVAIEIDSDRVRYRAHVLAALTAAGRALAASALTPQSGSVEVVARVRHRKVERHVFRCLLQPLRLYARGRLRQKELWSTYIAEQRRGAAKLAFSDDEARGGGHGGDDEGGPDRTNEILAAHFSQLAPCLSGEARRNRRFRGVTLVFSVAGSGRATSLSLKERGASGRLRSCLSLALSKIRFPRHGGAPRRVSYPMYIQR